VYRVLVAALVMLNMSFLLLLLSAKCSY